MEERTVFVKYSTEKQIEPTDPSWRIGKLTVRADHVCCFNCFENKITPTAIIIQMMHMSWMLIPYFKGL